jgi:hypothetical protein
MHARQQTLRRAAWLWHKCRRVQIGPVQCLKVCAYRPDRLADALANRSSDLETASSFMSFSVMCLGVPLHHAQCQRRPVCMVVTCIRMLHSGRELCHKGLNLWQGKWQVKPEWCTWQAAVTKDACHPDCSTAGVGSPLTPSCNQLVASRFGHMQATCTTSRSAHFKDISVTARLCFGTVLRTAPRSV